MRDQKFSIVFIFYVVFTALIVVFECCNDM